MPRVIHKLTAVKVAAIKEPGLYSDGGGLNLRVTATQSKSWIFRYASAGSTRDMGLGPVPPVSLAMARKLAAECRELRSRDIDPIRHREQMRRDAKLKATASMTFRKCAETFLESHEPGWRNPKHRQQWHNTLKTFAYPYIGEMAINNVVTEHVLEILQQPLKPGSGQGTSLWIERSETASRLRGRIERILDWAKAKGLREGENPARWRGHMANLLAPPGKLRRVQHHPALPHSDIPEFMAQLRARQGIGARALEFTILTAARTGEVIGANFDEVDLTALLWVVPPERMKAGKRHRVPLAARAAEIVEEMLSIRQHNFVFPGMKPGSPISNMTMLELMRELRPGITVHGFRSTFRDWVAECTATPNFVAEAALAHVVADRVEAAYRRGDLLDKRCALMDSWGEYCTSAVDG